MQNNANQPEQLTRQATARRRLLKFGIGGAACTLLPINSLATPAAMQQAVRQQFGDQTITDGRIRLELPALAENGNSVRLTVAVDSPMTNDDHVRFVQLFAEQNPLPDIVRFEFSPSSGRAEISTRIRIAADQSITAIAGCNDGTLWSASAAIVVTEAACIDALY